jgi:DnaJ-class molecular chaperone
VKLNVGQHPLFKRDGFDVHYDASISMAQAALGTSIPVPTLSGEVLLKVSPGTQPGEKRIMRGKGIKMLNRQAFGDQYVHFKVNVPGPNKLNKRSRELLEQFAREQGEACNWTTPDPAVSQSQAQPQTNSQSQAAAADAAHAAHSTAADAAAASASSTKSSFAASFGAHHKKGHKAAAEAAEGSAAAVGEEAAKESPATAADAHAKEGEAKTNETNEEGKEGKKGKKKGGVFGSLFK